jgi:uncharacterized protein YndB with AHSA1/START domain
MADGKNALMIDTISPPAEGTAMPGSDADYQAVVTFEASPETVFDALTTVAGLAGWWAPVSGSGTEGGDRRFVFSGEARIEGMILAEDLLAIHVDAARRPSIVRWAVRKCGFLPDWVDTTPSFELALREIGCELRFRHHGLTPRLECFSACAPGWDHHLSSLHDYVESGQGRPFGSDAVVDRERR